VVHGYQAVVDWDRVDEGKIRALVEINVELDRETGYEQVARPDREVPRGGRRPPPRFR